MLDTNDDNKILDKYFANLNLDEELKKISMNYVVDQSDEEYRKKAALNELRSHNHYRYYNIDFTKLDNLTEDINVYVRSIKELYKLIDPKVLLTENEIQADQHKIVLIQNVRSE